MKNIALLGYSGHAFVVADTIQLMGYNINGYYDVKEALFNPFDLNFLGNDRAIVQNLDSYYFPAVGSNKLRKKLIQILEELGCMELVIQHPSSVVSRYSQIETSTIISAGACINAFTTISKGGIINTSATIEHECYVGSFSHIAPGATLAGNVKVGSETFIGANAVVKQGIIIGSNVVVGAGSVVISDIKDNQTWAGNPAKQLS
jgi:sugar O-acyltransferase (sialic acid O-acetyltransferase NeuD family)